MRQMPKTSSIMSAMRRFIVVGVNEEPPVESLLRATSCDSKHLPSLHWIDARGTIFADSRH